MCFQRWFVRLNTTEMGASLNILTANSLLKNTINDFRVKKKSDLVKSILSEEITVLSL